LMIMDRVTYQESFALFRGKLTTGATPKLT